MCPGFHLHQNHGAVLGVVLHQRLVEGIFGHVLEVDVEGRFHVVAGLGLDFGAVVNGFIAAGQPLEQGFAVAAGQVAVEGELQARPVLVFVQEANRALGQPAEGPEALVNLLENDSAPVFALPENRPLGQLLFLLIVDLPRIQTDIAHAPLGVVGVLEFAVVLLLAPVAEEVRQQARQ